MAEMARLNPFWDGKRMGKPADFSGKSVENSGKSVKTLEKV
jgi:hypothetical protein